MHLNTNLWLLFVTFTSLPHLNTLANILRPRGVSISKASLYNPEKDFTCLDGSRTFPFSYVNDDYCDCRDGSDEPGTAACINGVFHCTNAGHKPKNVPASRVNDGICDCCDASDEWSKPHRCSNTCKELGKAARVEQQRKVETFRKGFDVKQDYIKRGKELRKEKESPKSPLSRGQDLDNLLALDNGDFGLRNMESVNKHKKEAEKRHLIKTKLDALEKERSEAEAIRTERERLKQLAEEPEKLALDYYKQNEDTEKKLQDEEEKLTEEEEAESTFNMLDSNGDGVLDIKEIQTRQTFDQNKDGAVSEEEAMFFLQMGSEMTKNEFLKTGWTLMKPYFMLDQGLFIPPSTETPLAAPLELQEDVPLNPDDDMYDEDEAELHKEMQDEVSRYESAYTEWEKLTEPADDEGDGGDGEEDALEDLNQHEPKYDEETQRLIEAANKARSDFDESDKVLRDIQGNIRGVMDLVNKDYGRDEEFAVLEGECFDYEDSLYTFKFCPFNEVNQHVKEGNFDVKLGAWGSWTGPDWDKYSKQKYERGHGCWNGPTRTIELRFRCGTENRVLSVSEPSRCEYLMEFATPAVCIPIEPIPDEHLHDEL